MQVEKDFNFWNEEENKKMQYNARAKHIIDYALNMEKLFKVSKCKNAQEL